MSLDVGQVLGGRYVVERLIGRGVLGAVFQGRDQTANRQVAIRLIQPEFDNDQVEAFIETDVRTAGQLTEAHIARLLNIGFLPTGERCVLSEYIDGETLKSRVKRLGRLPESQVLAVITQLLEALAAAHKAGVLHRDFTPKSVILASGASGAPERATLIDFGTSRLLALKGNAAAARSAGIELASLQYLAPEQLSGLREIDPRANIYSLGALAYEALTGHPPFEAGDFSEPSRVVFVEPKAVEELVPEASPLVAQLIRKALSRDPSARFQTADEMLVAVHNVANRNVAAVAPGSVNGALALGGPTRPAAAQASVQAAGSVRPPAGSPISAPPPVPPQAQLQGSTKPGSTPPQARPGVDIAAPFAVPVPAGAVANAAAAPAMAPVEEREPSSVRSPVSSSSRVTPPPPPPMDPTAADIDQSVVDALFAPPPVGARDDFALSERNEWDAPASVREPPSAPISELQPPRLEPASRPSGPKVSESASASSNAGATVPMPPVVSAEVALGLSASIVDARAPEPSYSTPESAAPAVEIARAPAPEPVPAIVERQGAVEPPQNSPATQARLHTVSEPESRLIADAASGSSAKAEPAETDEPAQPSKRTILGLGALGSQTAHNEQDAGPWSQRPAQATAPGIQPEAPLSSPRASQPSDSVSQRPTESQPASSAVASSASATAPTSGAGVAAASAATTATPGGPASSSAAATSARPTSAAPAATAPSGPASSATGSQASPSVKPAATSAPASAAPPTSKSATVTPVAAAVIMDTADELGPYGKRRSRKPLAIALLFVGLLGAGAAVALLQSHAEQDGAGKPEPSQVSPAPPRAEISQNKLTATPSAEVRERATTSREAASELGNSGSSTTLTQTGNGSLSQSVAAVQGKKAASTIASPAKPDALERPVAVTKPAASAKPSPVSKPATKSSSASSMPSRPAASKAASKDPYNYR